MTLTAIPKMMREPSRASVTIVECGEPLVLLRSRGKLLVRPAYFERGLTSAHPTILVREGVAVALARAASRLPDGFNLLVWDGLRTLRTQLEIGERFKVRAREMGYTELDLTLTLDRYLAPVPASYEGLLASPPPHSTGGAVDLTLSDVDGNPLDLGSAFDEFAPCAAIHYYETQCQRTTVSVARATVRLLRRLLFSTMLEAGFAPYPEEWWHFELNTLRAAAYYGRAIAGYGAAVPFDLNGATR